MEVDLKKIISVIAEVVLAYVLWNVFDKVKELFMGQLTECCP